MENICKITKLFVTLSLCLISIHLYAQNRYDIPNVYYNMDTTNCLVIEEDNRVESNEESLNILSDTSRLYRQIFKRDLSLPIVEIRDSSVFKYIDTLINESLKDGSVLFPDTSGVFVNLVFFRNDNDTQNMNLHVTPFANYYLYDVIFPLGYESFYKWYGYYEYSNVGCFFHNNILCIVRLFKTIGTSSMSCHYIETGETILLRIFREKVELFQGGIDISRIYNISSCDKQ